MQVGKPETHREFWFPFAVAEVLPRCSPQRPCLLSHCDTVTSVPAPPAIEDTVEALDGRRPVIRPIPHVAILRDEFTQLFNDDYEEEEEEMEARGEHTLSEKFGGHFAAAVSAVLCLELFRNSCWVCLFGEHTGPVECFSVSGSAAASAGGFLCPNCPGCCSSLSEVLTRSASRCSLPGAHVWPRLQPDL